MGKKIIIIKITGPTNIVVNDEGPGVKKVEGHKFTHTH